MRPKATFHIYYTASGVTSDIFSVPVTFFKRHFEKLLITEICENFIYSCARNKNIHADVESWQLLLFSIF